MIFKNFLKRVQSSEMFARPSKLLPGKWQLFEYYFEFGTELKNTGESQMTANNEKLLFELRPDKAFVLKQNLQIEIFKNFEKGNWMRKRNFISIFREEEKENILTFQFDATNETLKLLKKNSKGEIDFFGFFRRVD